MLNTGSLLRIAAAARASPSKPVVKEAEERVLANAVVADVEEGVDALIKQLEGTDHHGAHSYSNSCF
jgi:hypothetical protein